MASTITSKEYTGNGSLKTFTYAFQSYQEEDVKVKVNEVAVTNFTIPNYTASGGTVTFNNTGVNASVCESDGSPKNTLIVRVYRETDITSGSVGEYEAKATYVAGSSIKAADLNNCAKQALYATFENRDQEIQTANIANGAITSAKILDGTIAGVDIANDAIDSQHYAADSIDAEHYAPNSVDTTALAADAVTGAQIADDAIDSEHYVDGSIDEAHIAAGAITNNKMAVNSVASGNIVNGTIATADIANGAITTALLAADAVDSSRLADDACDSEHYTDGSIDRVHLEADIIDGTKLADNAVNTEHLTAGSVTNNKMANNSVASGNIVNDTIINTDINSSAAIDATKIADGSVTSTEFQYINSVTSNVQTQLDAKQAADAELSTLAGMQAGTASILAGGTALTSTLSELNLLDGKSIVTTISSPTDVQLPTAQAVEERIVDLVTDVGGFRPIANETSFPATNPDPEDNAGTIVSIKALAGNITSNGSGVVTIANGAGTGNTVTINGFANNDTIEAGKGLLVETTSTLHTYTFHRETLAPADVASASTLVSDFNDRYQVAGSAPSSHPDGSALADGDLWFDTSANTMKVYDLGNTSYAAVTSVGDYKLLTVVNDGQTSGSPTYNGSIVSYDLRDGSSAASITSVGQLLVSVNGVLQKPNSTSWSASNEGFHLEGTDGIKFCTAPPSNSSVFVTLIGSATSVNTPATNSIVEAAIQTNVVSEEKLKISNAPTNTHVLTADATVSGGMKWAATANASPTTTRGDIIYRGASADERLAKGTSGQYLKIGANDPEWADVVGAVADGCIFENDQTISNNYTIAAGKGAHSVGPITVNATVTVNGNWVVS